MAEALQSDITENGVSQGDLVRFMKNVRDVVNELITDHASYKTTVDSLVTLCTELRTDHATAITFAAELKVDADAAFADLTAIRAAIVAITAKLDADAGVTDVNYAATCDPAALTITTIAATNVATITAAAPTAGPATLTNSTALTLVKG
jgi:plasmid maintenance system antidote protein VapI